MMTIKALVPFVGEVVMNTDETREVSDEIAKDLIGAGYATSEAKAKPAEKPVEKPVKGKTTKK
jgi:hypothetical protein